MHEARLLGCTSKRSRDLRRPSHGGHGHTWSASGLPWAFERLMAFSFFPPRLVSQREQLSGWSQAGGTEDGGGQACVSVLWLLEPKPPDVMA